MWRKKDIISSYFVCIHKPKSPFKHSVWVGMQVVFERENLLHLHSMDWQQTHFSTATASEGLE